MSGVGFTCFPVSRESRIDSSSPQGVAVASPLASLDSFLS